MLVPPSLVDRSTLLVVAAAVVAGVCWWSRSVLADDERYLTAVARLPRSPVARRASGWLVVSAARGRGGGVRGVDRRFASLVSLLMATRGFGWAWSRSHRWLHGQRRRHPHLRARPIQVTMAMLLLAGCGEVLGLVDRHRMAAEGA